MVLKMVLQEKFLRAYEKGGITASNPPAHTTTSSLHYRHLVQRLSRCFNYCLGAVDLGLAAPWGLGVTVPDLNLDPGPTQILGPLAYG